MNALPYAGIGSGELDEFGGFLHLIDTLECWRDRLRSPYPVEEWHQHLLHMLEDFFDLNGEEQPLALLREAIAELRADCLQVGMNEPLAVDIIRQYLENALSQPAGGQAFLSGRVTFCNMVPMRSVPFRVICLLGMNDHDFPRVQHPVVFDLMGQHPRLGDRNRRNDDRYLFLESLLSARDVISISWLGRNQRDDSIAPPSVVVCELLDYLKQSCHPIKGISADAYLTTLHPLQPFSPRCFDGNAATASYNQTWLPRAEADRAPLFFTASLGEPDPERASLDVRQFVRFWRHPVRYFLSEMLGMHIGRDGAALLESEPFTLDHLQQYQLRQEIVTALLERPAGEPLYRNCTGSGRLPQGGFGQVQFDGLLSTGAALAEQLAPLLAASIPAQEIDLTIGTFHLTGWLGNLSAAGRVTWRGATLKGVTLLDVWIHHLILNMLQPSGVPLSSQHVARGRPQDQKEVFISTFKPVAEPEVHLQHLLALYWQGLQEPLHFFPETSWSFAAAEPEKAMQAACRSWRGVYDRPGEGDDPAYGYFFAQTGPLDEEFIRLSSIFATLLQHMEEASADA